MRSIRIFCRILIGIIFIFSGFVKAIDPLGSTYKFSDYFNAFMIGFLEPLALPLAILLSAVELIIGLNLILGIRMKITSGVLLIFMLVFTVITLILAVFNPVSDCGCFGDAVILTNWQTFWKNIILLVPTIIVYISRNKYIPFYKAKAEWILTSIFFIIGILISVDCYLNLPYMDFRPYKVGANIPESMEIPEGMPVDEYETILIYEKDGVQKEFTTDNYPWQDTTWKWVETRQHLIKKGYEPPIHDFTITSPDMENLTDVFLNDPEYSFLFISYDLSSANKAAFLKANRIALDCAEKNCTFYCLTSSTADEINKLRDSIPLEFDIYTADDITLKTIIRSNPGLVLIRNGIILGKWHFRNLPDTEDLTKNYTAMVLDNYRNLWERLRVYALATTLIIVIVLFHLWYTGMF